jgi:hypothetical protein
MINKSRRGHQLILKPPVSCVSSCVGLQHRLRRFVPWLCALMLWNWISYSSSSVVEWWCESVGFPGGLALGLRSTVSASLDFTMACYVFSFLLRHSFEPHDGSAQDRAEFLSISSRPVRLSIGLMAHVTSVTISHAYWKHNVWGSCWYWLASFGVHPHFLVQLTSSLILRVEDNFILYTHLSSSWLPNHQPQGCKPGKAIFLSSLAV